MASRHKVKVWIIGNSIGDVIVFPCKGFSRQWRNRVTDEAVFKDGVYLDGWRGRDDVLASIPARTVRDINTMYPVGAYIDEDSACALFGCEY